MSSASIKTLEPVLHRRTSAHRSQSESHIRYSHFDVRSEQVTSTKSKTKKTRRIQRRYRRQQRDRPPIKEASPPPSSSSQLSWRSSSSSPSPSPLSSSPRGWANWQQTRSRNRQRSQSAGSFSRGSERTPRVTPPRVVGLARVTPRVIRLARGPSTDLTANFASRQASIK